MRSLKRGFLFFYQHLNFFFFYLLVLQIYNIFQKVINKYVDIEEYACNNNNLPHFLGCSTYIYVSVMIYEGGRGGG